VREVLACAFMRGVCEKQEPATSHRHDHPEFFIENQAARPVPRISRAIARGGLEVQPPGGVRSTHQIYFYIQALRV
jgi:hypothetical protein